MSTIEKSIDVEVPVRTAYNQWTQFESFPRFMEGVESVRQLDDTHLHWKARDRRQDARVGRRDQRADPRQAHRVAQHARARRTRAW